MSISSGSGASASSLSSDASAMAITRALRGRAPARCAWRRAHRGVECRGFRHSIAEIAVTLGTQATPTSRPHLVCVAQVHDCASRPFGRRRAPPCLVHGQAFERAVEDGVSRSVARLRLDAALEAAEDGHVTGLEVQRALWREEAQHDVWERRPHGGQASLAWMLAMRRIHACPSLLGFSTLSRVAVSCRSVVVVAQPFSDVTW